MKDNNKKSKSLIVLSIIAILLMATGRVFAGGGSNPRAMAMGCAYNALAFGYEAPDYNPANLGLSHNNKKFTIGLFSVGVNLGNNSLSLKDYNEFSGKHLTENDKISILGKIPNTGITFNALAEVNVMSFSYNSFAVSIRAAGEAKANIDKDMIQLLLYGNADNPEFVCETVEGAAMAIADVSVSYGRHLSFDKLINVLKCKEMSVGATSRYLKGITYFDVVSADGPRLITTETGLESEGSFIIETAMGGSGFAFDLGAAMIWDKQFIFDDEMVVSVSLQNVFSGINWNKDTERLYKDYSLRDLNYDSMADSLLNDSLFVSNDSTIAISSFTKRLPIVLRVGTSCSIKKIKLALDMEQYTSSGISQTTIPRLSFGGEYKLWNFLPLRAGLSMGGGKGSAYSTGLGLHFNPLRFDFAIANNMSLQPGTSKGIISAFAMGFWF